MKTHLNTLFVTLEGAYLRNYGQRVQNSVFECKVDPGQFVELKSKLCNLMNSEEDSIRFYNLGRNWRGHVEHFGQKEPYDPDGPLIV